MLKENAVRWVQTRLINPRVMRHAGDAGNRYAVLETIGRKSATPRRIPVGNGLRGDVFWIVSEQGRNAQYVRNVEADPHVRIKVNGSWRRGTARIMPDEDPAVRLKDLDPRTAAEIRRMGGQLLTVRVDLKQA